MKWNPARAAVVLALAGAGWGMAAKGPKKPEIKPLDRYVMDAEARAAAGPSGSPGSLYEDGGRLGDLARDRRAALLDDIVTIVVADRASAVSRGGTTSKRQTAAKASVTAMGGPTPTPGPLSGLADLSGESKLTGQGETSRGSSIDATLSARVVKVLPNGNLILEGHKQVLVNSEWQLVTVRGVARWTDIGSSNRIAAERLAELEVLVNGKGVVNDAIRRPNIIYRLLLGLLPF
jgi:flagellar L-ring protein precursor FlgH